MRRTRYALTALLLMILVSPTAMLAQESRTAKDTLAAAESARRAAKKDPVVPYFIAGMVGAPTTLVTVVEITGSGRPSAGMAIGPVLIGMASYHASKFHSLPAEFELQLQGADSTYASVFRRTYDKAVSSRRNLATFVGGLVGIVGGIGLLALAFRNYT